MNSRIVANPLLLAGLVLLGAGVGPERGMAQVVVPPPVGALHLPQIPAQGEWLQVLTATDRWLVLQNDQGQQFPVAADAIGTFVMRWPTTVDRLDDSCLVEITGLDLGTSRVGADHADVYRGSARGLVTPTFQRIIGFNRVVTPFDLERQNVLGINLQYMLSPQELAMPRRIHVVAPPVNPDPLVLAIGGNNTLAVVPDAGMTLTDVTAGVLRFVRPGDLVFAVSPAGQTTPRTVVISLLVVYKDVPLDQFAR